MISCGSPLNCVAIHLHDSPIWETLFLFLVDASHSALRRLGCRAHDYWRAEHHQPTHGLFGMSTTIPTRESRLVAPEGSTDMDLLIRHFAVVTHGKETGIGPKYPDTKKLLSHSIVTMETRPPAVPGKMWLTDAGTIS